MKTTIFNTPFLSFVFHVLTRIIMRFLGWRVEGEFPNIPKFVLIGAPHTSNWDFVLFLGFIFTLRANVHFMGKEELFRFPTGWFFRYCGGIPVHRSRSSGLVDQMVDVFNKSDSFILSIAPEGTRYRVTEWKRGFYHIAKSAGVPIVIAVLDGKQKTVRIGQVFHPTEDIEADIKTIQGFFTGVVGINPRLKYITLED